MNYEPQVGDRVRLPHWGQRVLEVTAVGQTNFLAVNPEGYELSYAINLIDTWIKVEPRPKVAECVGYISDGSGFNYCTAADTAAWQADHKHLTPARIVAKRYVEAREVDRQLGQTVTVAVVCDLDGNPLEVQR